MLVQACVSGMLHLQEYSAFKGLLRDFLVQTKSFSSQDNADLFAEETAQKQAVSVWGVLPAAVQAFLHDVLWHCTCYCRTGMGGCRSGAAEHPEASCLCVRLVLR